MDIKLNLEEHENLKNLVLRNKYLLPTENTLEDIKERICRYIKDPYTKDWFRETKNFIPAGSILSGVALFGRSSLSNCYLTPILEDSIEGIFECCKHMARTYSYRGGSGVNISILRPKNHVVSNSAKFSSGAVSFMPLFSDVTGVIGQHGRRGALMMCMDIRHPDAMDFIWAKSKPEQVFGVDHFTGRVPDISHANISLLIPDSFMEACVNNLSWTFKFPDREANEELYEETWNGDFDDWTGEWKEYSTGSARSVLAQIAEAAWTTGDPGVIFLTTMKEFTPGSYIHPSLEPKGTNPCFPADTLLLDGDRLRRIDSPDAATWTSWKTGVKEVWEFETSIGLKFRCTPDHQIMLRDGSFIEAKDSIGRVLYPIGEFINPTVSSKEEEWVLAGFLFGDGHLSGFKENGVAVKLSPIKETEISDMLINWGFSSIKDKKDRVTFYINKHKLPENIVSILGKPSLEKEIPFDLMTSGSLIITSFLRGLFEANGSCNVNGQISYKTISYKLATQIQFLLRSLGIDASISSNTPQKIKWDNGTYESKKSYNIQIPPRCGKKFKEVIGFLSERKTNNIQTFNNKTKSITRVTDYKVIGEQEVWDFRMKGGFPWNFCGGIVAHNCGEQPLANWNNCLLGALVLPNYVNYPFTKDAKFDMETFEKDVYQAVYFLNNLSDTNENMHPLPEQQEADKFGKRIGLEFTGLADTFAMMGLLYGSLGSIQFIEPILKRKALTEIEASLAIAKEKGCCPAFQFKEVRENFLDSPYIENLDLDNSLKKEIIEHGLRNTAFNTVGPTGSISILANNCTSGIEPLYAMSYQRSLRGEDKTFDFIHKPVLDFIIHNPVFRESLNDTGLIHDALDELKRKLNYIEAFEIPWEDRIALQSIVQEYTDSGVSSTINLSNDIAPRTIEKIIMEAWQQDLKGITVFRDGCKKGIYSTGKEQEKALSIGPYIKDTYDYEPGGRHRVYWHGSKLYVMVSQDNDGLPLEIFAILPREAGINGAGVYQEALYQEKYSLWSTITRLTSLLCRSDIPLELIIKQLDKSTFSVNDASAVLARILRVYLPIDIDDDGEELGLECPDCGERTVFMQGGCPICRSCGYSRC